MVPSIVRRDNLWRISCMGPGPGLGAPGMSGTCCPYHQRPVVSRIFTDSVRPYEVGRWSEGTPGMSIYVSLKLQCSITYLHYMCAKRILRPQHRGRTLLWAYHYIIPNDRSHLSTHCHISRELLPYITRITVIYHEYFWIKCSQLIREAKIDNSVWRGWRYDERNVVRESITFVSRWLTFLYHL